MQNLTTIIMNIAKNLTKVSSIISILCSIGVIVASFLPYIINSEQKEYTIMELSQLFSNVDSYMIVEKLFYLILAVMGLNIVLKIFTGNKWVTVVTATLAILAHITIISMSGVHHLNDGSYAIGFTIAAVCTCLMFISLFFSLSTNRAVAMAVPASRNKKADVENDKEVEMLREQYETLEKRAHSAGQGYEEELISDEEITVSEEDLIDSADVWVEDTNGYQEDDEKTRFK